MSTKHAIRTTALMLLVTALSSCSTTTSAVSMFEQLGGAGNVTKLAGNFMKGAAGNSQLTSLLGHADLNAITPKVSDQLCSMLGGGCKAPLTEQQIAAGASKVNPTQTQALGGAFNSALGSINASPGVQQAVTNMVGPKLSGIVGALL